ncbi:MAG: BON domain-containing protein [Armatimonadota bacterium]|nr:BON domain-containing protein [Armatimonadota bacterium]
MSATNPHVPENEAPGHKMTGIVRSALGESPDVNISNLVIQSSSGIVRLIGITDTLREKYAAGRIAAGLVGVGHVQNDLTVSSDRPISDLDMFRMVEQALGNYPESDPKQVGVRLVENGVAYLSGKTPTLEIARGAVDIAAGVKGVKRIVNEIDIAPGTPFDDIRLGNRVMDMLSDDPRIDPFDIQVRAENGDVYIDGEVEDREAREAATELAASVPGVKTVVNALRTRRAA